MMEKPHSKSWIQLVSLLFDLFSFEPTPITEKVCTEIIMSLMLLNLMVNPKLHQQHVIWLIIPFLKITFHSFGFQFTILSLFNSDLSRDKWGGTEIQIKLMHNLISSAHAFCFKRLEFSVIFIEKLCMWIWQNNNLFSPKMICVSSILYTGNISFPPFSENTK